MKRSSLVLCAFVVLAVLMSAPAAYAYIDPNTGGVIFQVLMPILAVLVGFIAFAWNFVKKQTLLIVHAVWRCMVSLSCLFIKKGRD
jgi:hypothetical protein